MNPTSASTGLGLSDSVRALAQEFGSSTGVSVATHIENVNLDETTQLAVYRLAQECLANIEKYARAHEVWIDLLNWEARTVMAVRDDGIGFDTTRQEEWHRDLAGMRELVEACGGELCVFSRPGKGTRVMALLPPGEAPRASPASTPS